MSESMKVEDAPAKPRFRTEYQHDRRKYTFVGTYPEEALPELRRRISLGGTRLEDEKQLMLIHQMMISEDNLWSDKLLALSMLYDLFERYKIVEEKKY